MKVRRRETEEVISPCCGSGFKNPSKSVATKRRFTLSYTCCMSKKSGPLNVGSHNMIINKTFGTYSRNPNMKVRRSETEEFISPC